MTELEKRKKKLVKLKLHGLFVYKKPAGSKFEPVFLDTGTTFVGRSNLGGRILIWLKKK